MSSFQVQAIPTKVAELVRATMRSPGYGHPAHKEVATGYGPCRHCLRTFHIDQEERILFTYDPFFELGVGALPGPIFVHAEECARYAEGGGFPDDLRAHALTLDVYGEGRRLITEEHVDNRDLDEKIEQFLKEPEVKYIHVRDKQAGCYDLRIERQTAT